MTLWDSAFSFKTSAPRHCDLSTVYWLPLLNTTLNLLIKSWGQSGVFYLARKAPASAGQLDSKLFWRKWNTKKHCTGLTWYAANHLGLKTQIQLDLNPHGTMSLKGQQYTIYRSVHKRTQQQSAVENLTSFLYLKHYCRTESRRTANEDRISKC